MKHPEQALHRQIADYLSWALAAPAYWTTIGHGGGGQMRGMVLKGMGVKAGFPDIAIFYEGRAFLLELKAPKGALSAVQKEAHPALKAAGCLVEVIRSLDEFRALVDGPWWWLSPCVRETKPSTERIRRGFTTVMYHGKEFQSLDWPESEPLGRRRRKAKDGSQGL